jgi:outer membrane immunogenic protein
MAWKQNGDWANIRGSALCPNPIASCASDTRALASFRGRLGWATGPVLLYGTGGLGYANTRFSALTIVGGLPALGATGSYTTDRWGYAAGAGIEYGFTPNWSAKLDICITALAR